MIDIVERLRDLAMYIGAQNEKEGLLLRDAADEIVRLRDDLALATAGDIKTYFPKSIYPAATGGSSSFSDIKAKIKK